MNTQAIKHKEIIDLINAVKMVNEALVGLVSIIEEEENEEKYILVKEAAHIADMTTSGVRYLITTEQIKSTRKGKKWMVYKPSLLKYLEWKKS